MRRAPALVALLAVAGCSLDPKDLRPELPVPPSWPAGDPYLRQSEAALPAVTYPEVFRDSRLRTLIAQALANNRNLRVAVANIVAARAQYRIQRADLFPQVNATARYSYSDGGTAAVGGGTGTGTGTGGNGNGTGGTGNPGTGTGTGAAAAIGGAGSTFAVNLGVNAFEIDLFGRVASLTRSAENQYFAQEAAARATRLTLVGDVASAWLTYAADRSLLLIAQQTVATAERTVQLTQARLSGGIAPRTDLTQAQQILSAAQSDLAQQRTLLAQDVNALQLLVGAPVDPALLPPTIDEAAETIRELPAGLDSRVLLRRPDVVQAEYQLRAANAEIGAARAALFPTISLTGLAGFASNALSSLFTGNRFTWSVAPTATYPIFRAGAGRAGVEYARAQREALLNQYELTVQTAFREVSDALARRGTLSEQLGADQRTLRATAETLELANARYRGGIDPFLNTLDAQRSYYTAQRTLVATRLTAADTFVTLYRVLGGDSTLDATADGPRPLVAAQQAPQQ
jgi:outer membrane protein, multidrug efflux system